MSGRKKAKIRPTVIRPTINYAALDRQRDAEERRRKQMVAKAMSQVAQAARDIRDMLESDSVRRFASVGERQAAEHLLERLSGISVPADPAAAERAAGHAAELARQAYQSLAPARLRSALDGRVSRLDQRLTSLPPEPALEQRRAQLPAQLDALHRDIGVSTPPAALQSERIDALAEVLDDIEATTQLLHRARRFAGEIAALDWAAAFDAAEWIARFDGAAGDSAAHLTSMVETSITAASAYQGQAVERSEALALRRAALKMEHREAVRCRIAAIETAIFAGDFFQLCPEMVLPASAQLAEARRQLAAGELEAAADSCESAAAASERIAQTAAERRQAHAAAAAAWQQRLDELAASVSALPEDRPDLQARIDALRSRSPEAAGDTADRLAAEIDSIAQRAAGKQAAETLARLLAAHAGVNGTDLHEVTRLGREPGEVLVAGVHGLQLEVAIDDAGEISISKLDGDEGHGCAVVDRILAELARIYGRDRIDYRDEDGTERVLPMIAAERDEEEESVGHGATNARVLT